MKPANIDISETTVEPDRNACDRGRTLFLIVSGIVTVFALLVLWSEVAPVLSPRASELQVKTNPKGAVIFVDGRMRGASPMKIVGLRPGPHQFRILKPGYFVREMRVQVLPNSRDTVEWELFPAPAPSRSFELAAFPRVADRRSAPFRAKWEQSS